MQLTVEIDKAEVDPEWDRFVESSRYGHPDQTSLWARVKRCYGWGAIRLKAYQRKELIGGVQILLRPLRRFGRIGYICKGPVFDLEDASLREAFADHLHGWAASNRIFYQVVELPYEGERLASELARRGYTPHPAKLPPSGLMTATLVLDLSLDSEALLYQMSRTKRRSIRHSMKSGLRFRPGTFDELKVFREQMETLCRRRNSSPTPPQADFFENLWRSFEGSGWMRFFVVEYDGEIVSGLVNFAFGEFFRCWKIGWSGAHADKCPDEFIFWNCMLWAKEHGFRWFDFVWLERTAAERVKNGERPSDTFKPDGITFAKLAYGGEVKLLPLPLSRFYHPAAHLLYSGGGRKLMESRLITNLAEKMHRNRA